jgi:phosphomevalonate kinase
MTAAGLARAPGKIVVSGAYAVLRGAPAIVTAVDRYVTAFADSDPPLITEEVAAAMRLGLLARAPGFDAEALREGDRKLGLGSSAAILVASLLCARGQGADRDALFRDALAAHRTAQGGGSGIDVAASVFGGTLCYRVGTESVATVRPISLPSELVFEVWSSPAAADTRVLIERVRLAGQAQPETQRSLFQHLFAASESALAAAQADDAAGFTRALREQGEGLWALGQHAGVPIRTDAIGKLAAAAREENAVVLPAGAGGGDVCLFAGHAQPSPALRELASGLNHAPLELAVDAPGARFLP